jgi:hypothetical protein
MKLLIIFGIMIAFAIGFTFLILYFLKHLGSDPVDIYLEDITEIESLIKTLPVSYESYRRIKDKFRDIKDRDNDTKSTMEAVIMFSEKFRQFGRKRA